MSSLEFESGNRLTGIMFCRLKLFYHFALIIITDRMQGLKKKKQDHCFEAQHPDTTYKSHWV